MIKRLVNYNYVFLIKALFIVVLCLIIFSNPQEACADPLCATSVGDGPYGVFVTPDGERVYVTNFNGTTVSVIDADPLSGTYQDVLDTITVGSGPIGISITTDGSRAYVNNYGSNNVSVIDTDPLSGSYNTVIDTITVGSNPHGIDITSDDKRAYVNNHLSNNVSVIDIDPLSGSYNTVIDTVAVGSIPSDIAITPDDTRAYVVNWGGGSGDTVSVIDTDPLSGTYNTELTTITVGSGALGVDVTPDGSRAYVVNYGGNSISVIDTDPLSGTYHTVLDTISAGSNPATIMITPDGTRAYMPNYGGTSVSVIDTDPLSGTYNTELTTITVGTSPIGYGDFISPDGTRAFVANYGSDTVSFLDTDPLSGTYNTEISACPDVTNPTVSTLSPADDATGVATNSDLVITFDETVDVESGYVTIKKSSDDSTIEAIDVTSEQVTGTGTDTITINPTSNLAELTEFYVQIDATAFDDPSGNSYAGIADTTTWNFTTADETAPVLQSFSPDDQDFAYEDIIVGADVFFEMVFDEVIQSGSGNLYIKRYSDDVTIETIPIAGNFVGFGTDTITYTFDSSSLSDSTNYYVTVDSGAIEDDYGNVYGGISNKDTWNFSTTDSTAPTILTLSPADNATDVATNSNLVITFDESVYTEFGSGNITIKKTSDNTTVETIDSTGGQVTGNGTDTITINPSSNFAESTGYYVQIDATSIDDAYLNSYVGIADTTTWNFTTADETAPTVSTLSPLDNATDVSISSNLVITFDENVDAETGNITIKKSSDDTTVATIDVTGLLISGSGTDTITINPSSDLDYSTSYYIQIDATAFDDTAGNSYAGIADTTTWNFTTESAPSSGGSGGGRSSHLQSTCTPSDRSVSVGDKVSFDIDIDSSDDYTFKWTKVLSGTDEDETHKFTEAGTYYPRAEIKNESGDKAVVNCGTITVSDDEEDEEEIEDEVTEDEESTLICSKYISPVVPIRMGASNDSGIVKKIQSFLNKYENTSIDESGFYDLDTETAVKNFQQKYSLQILSPWGFNTPTGIVYTTTAAKMNAIHCAESFKCPIFTEYTKPNDINDEVPTIKSFLNLILNTNLDTTSSIYDQSTFSAVKEFQTRYKYFVLKPWNLSSATGWWYQTSVRQANKFMGCEMSPLILDNGVVVD